MFERIEVPDNELRYIRQANTEVYIRGIHGEQNRALIDFVLHPTFEMKVIIDPSAS